MLVLVTGGTGFVGRNIATELVNRGHTARIVSRSVDGVQGLPETGVETVFGDVKDMRSIAEASKGVDAAVHLVGIIKEKGEQTFQAVHVEGTRSVVQGLKENGVKRLLHMSALGTHENAISRYHKTKWEAEGIVRKSGLDYTIFRPSIIFGPGDGFTTTLVDLVNKWPVVPVIGSGKYRLQPVPVEDVARCFIDALENPEHIGKTYELCGREQLTFNQMLDVIMSALGISKPRIHLPAGAVSPVAKLMEKVTSNSPITSDQLQMLREENICELNATIEVFNCDPRPFAERVREFVRPLA